MEAIDSLAGMVSNMLDFPLVGFLGRLVPVGGSEARQQVSRSRTPDGQMNNSYHTICPGTLLA